MVRVALSSLRHRLVSFAASFLSLFAGATILMASGSLFDTASVDGINPSGAQTLRAVAAVVGGWSLVLVTFAVTSTVNQQVQQRATDIALLKTAGATPGQLGRMIVVETMVLALLALAAAVVPGLVLGRWLLSMFLSSGQVNQNVQHAFGGFAIHLGAVVTLLAAVAGSALTAHQTARLSAGDALSRLPTSLPRLGRWRVALAAICLFVGLDLATVTVTVMRGAEDFGPMATAGSASIWLSFGLALLTPVLVRPLTGRLVRLVTRRTGAGGYLAGLNLAQHSGRLATVVAPIVVFTGISIATLSMVRTNSATLLTSGITPTAADARASTANLVVLGLILTFTGIIVVNTMVAATADRRREFAQHRLIGATPPQVRAMVAIEAMVLAATGVLLGALASVFTAIPFSVATTGSLLPGGGVGTLAAVIAVIAASAVMVLGATLAATSHVLRLPAADMVTAQ